MKMKKLILLALLVPSLLASQAHADGAKVVGNGGEGVYCPGSGEITLFDYYEANVLRGLQPNLGPIQNTYQQKLSLLLSRLAQFDPARAAIYRNRVNSFESESRFVTGADLTPIPDSNSPVIPRGCQIVQLAVQRPPTFPGEAYYLLDKEKWDLMSNDQRAGLVFHEIIYREALGVGATDSSGARYLNSTIASDSLSGMKNSEYLNILLKLNFWRYTIFQSPLKDTFVFIIGGSTFGIDEAEKACRAFPVPGAHVPSELELQSFYPAFGNALQEWHFGWEAPALFQAYLFDKDRKSAIYNLDPLGIHLARDHVVTDSLCLASH
jgi:hypothetical protein